MKFTIYQLENIHDCGYSFMGFDFAKKHDFKMSDYKNVFSGLFIDGDFNGDDHAILERLYRQFNRVTEEDCERLNKFKFEGHSISVSDIIQLNNKYYYCDSFGWTMLEEISLQTK